MTTPAPNKTWIVQITCKTCNRFSEKFIERKYDALVSLGCKLCKGTAEVVCDERFGWDEWWSTDGSVYAYIEEKGRF